LRIGRRDRRVVVQRFAESRNAFNEIEKAYTDLYTVWAHVKTQSGKEALQAEQVVASNIVVFNIRFLPITTQDVLLYNGQVYDIQSLNEIGRRKELELICTTAENE
jgi:SPP1 family predicted phage head-tail adaptor